MFVITIENVSFAEFSKDAELHNMKSAPNIGESGSLP